MINQQFLFEAPLLLTRDVVSLNRNDQSGWMFENPGLSAPNLMTSEAAPPFSTLYVDINLGCTLKRDRTKVCPIPMTGIFLPANYRFTQQIDVLIYLQGHHRSPVQRHKLPTPGYYPTNLTIQQYWNKSLYPFFALREGINASGKNLILVAPSLGSRSEAGRLIQSGGFDAYIDQILSAIRTYFAPSMMFEQPLSLGNLILASHSGGGLPMRLIASSKATYAAKIRECWGFDCTYNSGDDTGWAVWAKSDPSRKVFIYYIANSQTAPLATSLQAQARRQKLGNVFVSKSATGEHNKVPITYWQTRIQNAAFLQN